MSILLITTRESALREFIKGLEQSGQTVRVLPSIDADFIMDQQPELAVVDSAAGQNPLDAIMDLMRIDATINTAAFSAMEEKEFHDRCEGLGLLLERPLEPTATDAAQLMQALARVKAL